MLKSVLKQRVKTQCCTLKESSATGSDPEECRGRASIAAAKQFWQNIRHDASCADLRQRQAFNVLEALLHKGSLPVNTIGPKVWLTPGAISVAVDRLEKKELVKRKHTDDRRVRLVELTANGRALITKTFRKHAAAMEEVAGVLSKEERLMLLRLLKKLGKGGTDEP